MGEPQVDDVFEFAEKMYDRMRLADEIKKLEKQLVNATTTCGSCSLFMTPACPHEKHDRLGVCHGPCGMDKKCSSYSTSKSSAESAELCRSKIMEMQGRLMAV